MRDQSQDPMGGKRIREEAVAELRERNARLVAALGLLWAEVVASGNSDAKNNGWPKACAATREALQQSTEKP